MVVGYADDEETVKTTQLGAQSAVKVKYYVTEGDGKSSIEPSRIEPRAGVVKSKDVKIDFVPSGTTLTEELAVVDAGERAASRCSCAEEEGQESSSHADAAPL